MTIWVIDNLFVYKSCTAFFILHEQYLIKKNRFCNNKLGSFAKAFKLTIKSEADDPNKVIPGGRILKNIPYFSKLKRKTSSCGR